LISAGAPPQTLLGELTVLPRPVAGFTGPTSMGRKGRGGMGRGRQERKGKGYFRPGLGK